MLYTNYTAALKHLWPFLVLLVVVGFLLFFWGRK